MSSCPSNTLVTAYEYGFPLGHMTWKQPITVPLNAAVIDNREQYLKEILLRWLVTDFATTSDESVSNRQTKLVRIGFC